jgi:hypothetical protein
MRRLFIPSGAATPVAPTNEAVPGRAATGPIVVDIGEGRGALVLTSDEESSGYEVEIARLDDASTRTHVYVLPRAVDGGTIHAAVFPSLPKGTYVVFDLSGRGAQILDVSSGRITSARWQRGSSAQSGRASDGFSAPQSGVHGRA